ncbi:MAG: DUF2971 domain-containing protein [Sphingomonadaceae bacterium]
MNSDDLAAQQAGLDMINAILFPFAAERMAEIKANNTRFVHYTSAAAGISILQNNCVWLRNSSLMNDYSEVKHGLDCLFHAWNEKGLGDRFSAILNAIDPNSGDKLQATFNDTIPELVSESYLLSISEHGDGIEDRVGRLSMWRAYGSSTGVAFVFNQHPFISPSDALHAYTSPVLYGDRSDFAVMFERLVKGFEENLSFLTELVQQGWSATNMVEILRFAVLSAKHPGFREEREWRVIYNPERNPSANIMSELVVLNGVPQRIHKIPFVNHPDQGFTGATVPELLEKIIIGPSAHPYPIARAFADLLEERGVQDIGNKIVISDIPLRQ